MELLSSQSEVQTDSPHAWFNQLTQFKNMIQLQTLNIWRFYTFKIQISDSFLKKKTDLSILGWCSYNEWNTQLSGTEAVPLTLGAFVVIRDI